MAQSSGPPPKPLRPKIYSTGISEVAVELVVITTVFSVLAMLLSFIRFYVRGRATLGVDDYVLMVVVFLLLLQMIGGILRTCVFY